MTPDATPLPFSTPLTGALVRGALDLEDTPRGLLPHRLPEGVRTRHADPQLAMVEAQPAGVRVAFRTSATTIELSCVPTRYAYAGLPERPLGVHDLLVDGELVRQARVPGGDTVVMDPATGTAVRRSVPAEAIRFTDLPEREKDVELWLPHQEVTELVELRADAPVAPLGDRGRRTWLHHGSSISQGSNATSPTATWVVAASLLGGVDLANLGFGGSMLLDPFTARVMRDTPADLVSVKIGINLVNADLMRLRAFTPAVHGFLDTIRDGHPDTPLLVVSPLHCAIHETTPGPGAFDVEALAEGRVAFRATGDPADLAGGRLTLAVIRAELARVVAQRAATDPHLHHLDGLALFGEADERELPLPDRLHPDTAAHRRIAERFAGRVFGAGGAFEP
ncbi:GDSL-type esterase/lipase family protein [Lapillicoccus jejuensis]|uniref:GDSL-like lipase/acylhydrolase family protein n=1 Tax=Lapillicoccus jejuensis TaxID=402171 RepID=A0A542E3M3_9MICO|nr:SGNH/GDSL hydrolase family protein [Lapillicoccus jejuensis]TQJ09943.1 GDSL-like lipase/acylhydrolase family protein [Lapillicoccus jejuensis]